MLRFYVDFDKLSKGERKRCAADQNMWNASTKVEFICKSYFRKKGGLALYSCLSSQGHFPPHKTLQRQMAWGLRWVQKLLSDSEAISSILFPAHLMFELDQVEMSRETNQPSRGGGFEMLKAERPIPKRGVRQSVQSFLNRFMNRFIPDFLSCCESLLQHNKTEPKN